MSKPEITPLRPHQWETLSWLHGATRRDYLIKLGACSALLVIVPVLIAGLGLEFALMTHTLSVLLDVGGPEQPVTLLSLSSLLAIAALHLITQRLGSERIHFWLTRVGLLVLVVFLSGFGLIVSLTSFEVAASALFNPETGLDALDAWIKGDTGSQDDGGFGQGLREAFGEIGGAIALVLSAMGLGGVFFLTILVSHFLIDQGLTIAGNYIRARLHHHESRRLLGKIKRKDAELRSAASELQRLRGISKAQLFNGVIGELVLRADRALAAARHTRQLSELVKKEDRDDPIGGLGLSVLGFQDESFAIDTEAFNAALAEVEGAVTEHALKKIGTNAAKGISG